MTPEQQYRALAALGLMEGAKAGALQGEGGGGGSSATYQVVSAVHGAGPPGSGEATVMTGVAVGQEVPFVRTQVRTPSELYDYILSVYMVSAQECSILVTCEEAGTGTPTNAGYPVELVVEVVPVTL